MSLSGRRENRGTTFISKVPGTAYTDTDAVCSWPGAVGFRLAHEGGTCTSRGGSSDIQDDILAIRLAWQREEE